MTRPWHVVVAGLVLGILGAGLFAFAVSDGQPALVWVAWGLGALAGLFAFVGLIGMGVELGVRSAQD